MSDVTVYKGIRSYYPRMKVKMNHYSKLELSTAMWNSTYRFAVITSM